MRAGAVSRRTRSIYHFGATLALRPTTLSRLRRSRFRRSCRSSDGSGVGGDDDGGGPGPAVARRGAPSLGTRRRCDGKMRGASKNMFLLS